MDTNAIKVIPILFVVLAVAGIIAGTSTLTISKFKGTLQQCDATGASYANGNGAVLNSSIQTSNNFCVNSSNYGQLYSNTTAEYKASLNVQSGLDIVGQQYPTIGVISAMVIIISLIAGTFVYFRYF